MLKFLHEWVWIFSFYQVRCTFVSCCYSGKWWQKECIRLKLTMVTDKQILKPLCCRSSSIVYQIPSVCQITKNWYFPNVLDPWSWIWVCWSFHSKVFSNGSLVFSKIQLSVIGSCEVLHDRGRCFVKILFRENCQKNWVAFFGELYH